MAVSTSFEGFISQVQCADKNLDVSKPKIMGILNVTPDSFVDGGRYHNSEKALQRVAVMLNEGADIIDIGAESTRPHVKPVSLQEEIDRLLPVLLAVKNEFDTFISIDTYKPEVMLEAIKVGVHMINDVYALGKKGAVDVIARSDVGVCLMHMQGIPSTMQINPQYLDVTAQVGDFLEQRMSACAVAGIAMKRIVIDPGFGFGKTTAHNISLLKNLSHLKRLNVPILAGLSRKASIGEILAAEVEDRLFGSLSAHVIAYLNGANIIRTHDIKPTAQALRIAQAVIEQEY